jgi:hypothetical protein
MINQQIDKGIGYILKYDEHEEKGVLVYGNSASPILFFKKDCLSPLKTGQLAYFSVNEEDGISLKRASIDSIDIEAINNNKGRYIRFVTDAWFDLDFDFRSDGNDSSEPWASIVNDSNVNNLLESIITKPKPNSVNLYDSYTLDIFNINFWIDSSPIHITQERLFLLFDLFIIRRNTVINIPHIEKQISLSWSIFLSSFTNDQLHFIYQKQNLFQSVLPISFCEDNFSILSLEYGFPNNDVCEHYLRFRIESISTTTDYYELKSVIQKALSSNTFHRQDPTTQEHYMMAWPTYKERPKGRIEYLSIDILREMSDSLNQNFWKILPPIVNRQLQGLNLSPAHFADLMLTPERIAKLIEEDRAHYMKTLGLFLDEYYCISDRIANLSFDTFDTYKFKYSYEKLFCDYYATARYLWPITKAKAKECITSIIRNCENNGFLRILGGALINLFSFLEEGTIDEAQNRINEALNNTENAEDILWAICNNLVDEDHLKGMIDKYKTIVRDYTPDQFERDICNDSIPIELQVFIIQKIIDNSSLNSKAYWLKSLIGVYIKESAFLTAIEPYIIILSQDEKKRLLDLSKPDYSKDYDDYLAHKIWENSIPEDNDQYSGTYAHDEAGFSDEEIDSIFDGDPSAYWNID